MSNPFDKFDGGNPFDQFGGQSVSSGTDDVFNLPPADPKLQSALNLKAANANPIGSALDPIVQGTTLGFSDELAGLISGAQAKLQGKDFGPAYEEERQWRLKQLENYRTRHPIASAGEEIAGAALPAIMTMGSSAGPSSAGLLARMGLSAGAGAGSGALYGAGAADEGLTNRLAGSAAGAASGTILGGALPLAASAAKFLGKPVADAVLARIHPEAYAAQKVAERAGPMGIEPIINRISRASDVGQNMSVADVGGRGMQKLARTIANIPGAAGDRLASRVNLSAMAQGDRLKRIVSDVFHAPEGAYQDAKTAIMDARSHAAEPFYREAYDTPIDTPLYVNSILQTPAGRSALSTARRNALNMRRPWMSYFINAVDEEGNITDRTLVPNMRALDETQRILRGMEQEAMATPDGSPFARPRATPQSIAINSVHRDLLSAMDAAGESAPGRGNGPFSRARSVGLDNIQADEALEFGRNALNTDSRVISQRMGVAAPGRDRALTEGQRELARVGLAEAIRDKIDKAGLTHNGILKFFATREQAARLRPFFSSPEDYSRFRQMILNEARKQKTVNAVRGNSTTASQLADMQDANQLGETARGLGHVMRGAPLHAAMTFLSRSIGRLGGMTPQVADNISRMLMSSHPDEVRGILTTIRRIESTQTNRRVRDAKIRGFLTSYLSGQTGRVLAPQQENAPAFAIKSQMGTMKHIVKK